MTKQLKQLTFAQYTTLVRQLDQAEYRAQKLRSRFKDVCATMPAELAKEYELRMIKNGDA